MRFRTVVFAAAILVLASVAGLAAFQLSDEARGEAGQMAIDRNDSLAVEPDVRQKLVSDRDHSPTRYGDSVVVEYNGTVWDPEGNYTYYPDEGEIEFERDESGEANVSYTYYVPEDQVADEQLQTLTGSYGDLMILGVGLAFVVLLLFIGAFTARKMGIGKRSRTGR